MLFSRSLMSPTGKDRSTRALPSTDPSRWKKPTPDEYSTTWPIGRLALFASFSWSLAAGRAPEKEVQDRPRAHRPTPANAVSTQALRMIDSPEEADVAGQAPPARTAL